MDPAWLRLFKRRKEGLNAKEEKGGTEKEMKEIKH